MNFMNVRGLKNALSKAESQGFKMQMKLVLFDFNFSIFSFFFFFTQQQRFLGDYSDGLFTDIAALEAILRFQEKISDISRSIKERNKKVKIPYVYLLPERTPNSIAI